MTLGSRFNGRRRWLVHVHVRKTSW